MSDQIKEEKRGRKSNKRVLDEPKTVIGKLKSSVNYPMFVRYDNDTLAVPPQGVINNVDYSKLVLPLQKGVKFVS